MKILISLGRDVGDISLQSEVKVAEGLQSSQNRPFGGEDSALEDDLS